MGKAPDIHVADDRGTGPLGRANQQSSDDTARTKAIYRITLIGSLCNFVLLIFKFVAGIVGHSSAMIADAVHSLSDFISDFVVLIFVRISGKPQDSDHDYGHGKYETLATAIIGILLLAVAVGIFLDAADRIWRYLHGEVLEKPGMIALWAALISIGIKEVLYHATIRVSKRSNSPVLEANAWHHRSDALSSIGTAVGIGGAIIFGVKGRVLDPLAAVIVSIFIVKVAIGFVKNCVDELLEKSLPADVETKILEAVHSVPEAKDPHNLRTRRIGNYASVEVHVRMPGDMTVTQSHDITKLIEERIREQLGPKTYVNIHVEPEK